MDYSKLYRKIDLISGLYDRKIFNKYGLFNSSKKLYLFDYINKILKYEYNNKINLLLLLKFVNNNYIYSFLNRKTYICFDHEYINNNINLNSSKLYQTISLDENKIKNFSNGVNNRINKNMNKYFDNIYVLNLERRTDRKIKMIKTLKDLNIKFQFFNAIDGKNRTDIIEQYNNYSKISLQKYRDNKDTTKNLNDFKNQNFDYHKIELNNNVQTLTSSNSLSILYSYKNIILNAKKNNYKKILILQDDCIFHKNFITIFNNKMKNINNNWKIIYYGASQVIKINKKIINNSYYHPKNTDGAFAIGYSYTIYDELLYQINRFNCNYDWGPLRQISQKYNKDSYVIYPNIVIADVTNSDNQKNHDQEKIANMLDWNLSSMNFIKLDKIVILWDYNINKDIDTFLLFIENQNYENFHIYIKSDNVINYYEYIKEKINYKINNRCEISIEINNEFYYNYLLQYQYFYIYNENHIYIDVEKKDKIININNLLIPIQMKYSEITTYNYSVDTMLFFKKYN